MKRTMTAACLAAAFAVGLSAQSTGTTGSATQDTPAAGGQGRGGPRTATGCLRAGDTAGTYVLTDVTMQGGGGRRGGGAAAGGTTAGGTTAGTATGAGTTAGTGTGTGTGTTASGGQGRGGGAVQTLMLNADASIDLKPHVGHKMEVTGTMAGGGGRRGGDTTAGGTATGTGATTGTATGTGTGTATGTTAQGGGRGTRTMNVTAIKMIANTCS
jgi:hypothetical protein